MTAIPGSLVANLHGSVSVPKGVGRSQQPEHGRKLAEEASPRRYPEPPPNAAGQASISRATDRHDNEVHAFGDPFQQRPGATGRFSDLTDRRSPYRRTRISAPITINSVAH